MKKIFSLAILFMAFACKPMGESGSFWHVTYQNNSSVDVALIAYCGANEYKYDIEVDASKVFAGHDWGFSGDVGNEVFIGNFECDSVQIVFAEERVLTYSNIYKLISLGELSIEQVNEYQTRHYATVEITPEMYESAVPITK